MIITAKVKVVYFSGQADEFKDVVLTTFTEDDTLADVFEAVENEVLALISNSATLHLVNLAFEPVLL